jgi:hypothetical protein
MAIKEGKQAEFLLLFLIPVPASPSSELVSSVRKWCNKSRLCLSNLGTKLV